MAATAIVTYSPFLQYIPSGKYTCPVAGVAIAAIVIVLRSIGAAAEVWSHIFIVAVAAQEFIKKPLKMHGLSDI